MTTQAKQGDWIELFTIAIAKLLNDMPPPPHYRVGRIIPTWNEKAKRWVPVISLLTRERE